MKPEKNGGACAAPAAGDRNGEGVPCKDARRDADCLGDSPPDALRGCDDDLAELGRCAAGEPGVLGLRPWTTVTVLGAIDGRFCDEANGETKVIPPAPPRLPEAVPLEPGLVPPPPDPPLVVLAGDSGTETSTEPGVAARASELRRTLDSRGNEVEVGLIAGDETTGGPPGVANGLLKKAMIALQYSQTPRR